MKAQNKKPTTGRMEKFLHENGMTGTQFSKWCGFGVAEWLSENPTWTEKQWAELVLDNKDQIVKGDKYYT